MCNVLLDIWPKISNRGEQRVYSCTLSPVQQAGKRNEHEIIYDFKKKINYYFTELNDVHAGPP